MTQARSRLPFLVAEAFLIVTSILLAFAIDAAWDRRNEARNRRDLLLALHADFTATARDLDEVITRGEELVGRTGGYLRAVRLQSDIPRDSLSYLFAGVEDAAFFQSTLASYRTALTTGSIELVRSPTLIASLTDFDFAEGLYQLHLKVSADLYYQGPLQDLRRAGVRLDDPDRRAAGHPFTVPADFDLYSTLAVASAEPIFTVQVNMLENLQAMRRAAESVLSQLDSLVVR